MIFYLNFCSDPILKRVVKIASILSLKNFGRRNSSPKAFCDFYNGRIRQLAEFFVPGFCQATTDCIKFYGLPLTIVSDPRAICARRKFLWFWSQVHCSKLYRVSFPFPFNDCHAGYKLYEPTWARNFVHVKNISVRSTSKLNSRNSFSLQLVPTNTTVWKTCQLPILYLITLHNSFDHRVGKSSAKNLDCQRLL